jgi:hypothetical protein
MLPSTRDDHYKVLHYGRFWPILFYDSVIKTQKWFCNNEKERKRHNDREAKKQRDEET